MKSKLTFEEFRHNIAVHAERVRTIELHRKGSRQRMHDFNEQNKEIEEEVSKTVNPEDDPI